MKENNEQPIIDILDKITYNTEDYLKHFIIKPFNGENTPWDIYFWSKYRENITSFHYHYNYGHCLTIDVSAISKNNGKFPFTYGSGTGSSLTTDKWRPLLVDKF